MLRLAAAAFLATALTLPAPAQSVPDWAAPATVEPHGGFASLVPCPPGQSDDGTGTCTPDPPVQVPLDGGLALLALAGAGLAARRLRSSTD